MVSESFNVYENRDNIPKGIRHYAPEGKPTLVGPDMAAIFGVQNILYPNFPKCGHPDYIGKNCVAESCRYAEENGYEACPYFDKNYNG